MPHSAQWERVEAAIRGEPVDRAPFGFWMHVPEIDRDPEKLALFTVDLYRRYRMDYVKVMFRSSWGLEDWGAAFDTFHSRLTMLHLHGDALMFDELARSRRRTPSWTGAA